TGICQSRRDDKQRDGRAATDFPASSPTPLGPGPEPSIGALALLNYCDHMRLILTPQSKGGEPRSPGRPPAQTKGAPVTGFRQMALPASGHEPYPWQSGVASGGLPEL